MDKKFGKFKTSLADFSDLNLKHSKGLQAQGSGDYFYCLNNSAKCIKPEAWEAVLQDKVKLCYQEFDSGCDENGQHSRRLYFRAKNIKKSENESSSKVVLESVRKLFDACRTLNTAKYVACFIIVRDSRRRCFIEGVFLGVWLNPRVSSRFAQVFFR